MTVDNWGALGGLARWQSLYELGHERYTDNLRDEETPLADPPLANQWATEGDDEEQQEDPSFQRENDGDGSDYDSDSDDSDEDDGDDRYIQSRVNAPTHTPTPNPPPFAPTTAPTPTPVRSNRRPQRNRRPPARFGDYTQLPALIKVKVNENVLNQAFLNSLNWNQHTTGYEKKFFYLQNYVIPILD